MGPPRINIRLVTTNCHLNISSGLRTVIHHTANNNIDLGVVNVEVGDDGYDGNSGDVEAVLGTGTMGSLRSWWWRLVAGG